ncbi:sentrin-specific protease 8 [Dictyostelium discoideum AX4]|uniref:Probable sentrin-specific protease 8 n=1 Tax=Dictyostelium discoideum TaxID=44689 RepID=SENP8_DICDI|nr:sentrin-specific protease 8 [Dictyostelium discoideum AX4]Q54XR2.1 RecName: Full=Probable sentrin-specific protease 8; AltName: Full=Deneddylase; AltName: Full=Sentrin/sumo-specific protease senp8 [Dictyostelium discoideum]EAL67999.1 sentrin-specific protease 8 [Dictyostelium discoideum AX4]|eukprot:XP_641968.1 sentrin-specific protease 8 [Dictyostelium discoideum AX4]
MSDPLIVSYNDSAIYQSDINILKSNQWLNDSIISFYLEWLKDGGEDNKNKIPNQVLLLSPSVVFCCSFVESEQEIQLMFEQPLSLKTKEVIFFPLTNNRDPNVIGGGTHWSLLIFIKSLNKFIYYDSINSFNSSDAIFIISKFKFLLSSPPPKTNLKEFLINQKTPQQQNGYDCGLYVLSIIEELLKLIIKENENNKGEENKISYKDLLLSEFTNELLFKEITPNYIKDKRVEILNTILKLKK